MFMFMYFGGFEHLHNLLGEASDVHGAVVWRFWDYQRLGHVMFGRLLNKHTWRVLQSWWCGHVKGERQEDLRGLLGHAFMALGLLGRRP